MIDVLISPRAWDHKPMTRKEKGTARVELKGTPRKESIEHIAESLGSGFNICAGVTKDGKGSRENFISQQMILIDVDEVGITLAEGIRISKEKGLYP